MAEASRVSNSILAERIEQQGKSLTEISCNLKTLNTTFATFMQTYGVEHEKVAGSTTAAHRRIDKIEERIDDMEKSIGKIGVDVQTVMSRMGIIIWIFSGLGMLILALLFKVFTGEAAVVFP